MNVTAKFFGTDFLIFFLAAGIFAIFAMSVWEFWLSVHHAGGMIAGMPFAIAPHLWHAHEMIFSYGLLAIVGFLHSAVPTRAGAVRPRQGYISLLFIVWLAGRLAIWWSGSIDPILFAVADIAFFPLLVARIVWMLGRRPKLPPFVPAASTAVFFASNLLMIRNGPGSLRRQPKPVHASALSLLPPLSWQSADAAPPISRATL